MSKKELNDLVNLMEEFSWVISKYKNVDFKNVQSNLLNIINEQNSYDTDLMSFKRYKDKDSNKNYLIGVLPKFFQDKDLFEKNLDLAEFAECLGIYLNNPEKKSRYEIIGTMLCNISEMDELSLDRFVRAIELLLVNEPLRQDIKKLRDIHKSSYSWNQVIKALSGQNK
jgi:hypothetical protein